MSRTILAALAAGSIASAATAQHVGDINLSIEQGAIHTAAFDGATSTPSRVFGATFGDTGVARFTSNPGFEASPGTFTAGSRTGFTPLSGLSRFTGDGLEPVTVERLELKFLTLASIVGVDPAPGFDLAVQSNGGWHRHLNFRLFAEGGKLPSSGIYVVEMELYSNDGVTLPSEPLWIVFNDGRSLAEHDAAIAWVADNLANGGTSCPADLDGNGDVGASDLATLLAAWGTAGADLGGDGSTDAADLATLLASWGACP
ncbi:MAG: hypothetical protein RLY21_1624 [Planctomycetota bacterium]|jgi:hypothetical protein